MEQVGVAWYRYPDEDHNCDGRHITYLDQPDRYEHLDPVLFHHLRNITKDARSINSLLPVLGDAVRRQSFPESLGRFLTEALVRFLFKFRQQRLGAASGVV